MKRRPILNFFDISSDVEELPKNELFKLKGGYSDIDWEEELDPVDVSPPEVDPGEDEEDDDWINDDDGNDYDDDYFNDIIGEGGGGGADNGGGDNSNADPIQQILAKVKFDSNITEQFKENFKNALESIKETKIGKLLLDKLASKAGDITVTNDGAHSVQGSTLNVGMFDSPPSDFIGKYQTLSLGHELFHLTQNAEYGKTRTEISYEVEARLFEYKLAKELLDLDNFLRNFATDSYRDAFIDFVEGSNNTIGDFNNLIDGFKDGMNGGATYDGFDETHINSWDDIIWDNINIIDIN